MWIRINKAGGYRLTLSEPRSSMLTVYSEE